MVRPNPNSIERAVENAEDEVRPLNLWTAFIEGRWIGHDLDELHPQLREWIETAGADPKDIDSIPAYVGRPEPIYDAEQRGDPDAALALCDDERDPGAES